MQTVRATASRWNLERLHPVLSGLGLNEKFLPGLQLSPGDCVPERTEPGHVRSREDMRRLMRDWGMFTARGCWSPSQKV